MTTMNQLLRGCRSGKTTGRGTRAPALRKRPQLRGECQKVYIKAPKKPNSAQRAVAIVKLSTEKLVTAYIPGQGPHGLQEHSNVLIRGGRVKDLPGVLYKVVRGVRDLKGVENRVSSRSKYGVAKSKDSDADGASK